MRHRTTSAFHEGLVRIYIKPFAFILYTPLFLFFLFCSSSFACRFFIALHYCYYIHETLILVRWRVERIRVKQSVSGFSKKFDLIYTLWYSNFIWYWIYMNAVELLWSYYRLSCTPATFSKFFTENQSRNRTESIFLKKKI